MTATVEQYLDRISYSGPTEVSYDTLASLQRHHLTTVPFENLHVFQRVGVRTDLDWSLDKVVHQRRGGWCFELNGAFGWLLEQLGFSVTRLGAAVLLAGPTKVIDHLTIEVMLDEPWLVDVGFGDSFIRPLRLNDQGEQDGGTGTFQFIPSPQGTTLSQHEDGVPAARYRFKRTSHELADFDPASHRLQTDPELHWQQAPFATRLLAGGPDRVTLLADRLKFRRAGEVDETPVAPEDWAALASEWFGLTVPGDRPPR